MGKHKGVPGATKMKINAKPVVAVLGARLGEDHLVDVRMAGPRRRSLLTPHTHCVVPTRRISIQAPILMNASCSMAANGQATLITRTENSQFRGYRARTLLHCLTLVGHTSSTQIDKFASMFVEQRSRQKSLILAMTATAAAAAPRMLNQLEVPGWWTWNTIRP
jgi:hypothetical protein